MSAGNLLPSSSPCYRVGSGSYCLAAASGVRPKYSSRVLGDHGWLRLMGLRSCRLALAIRLSIVVLRLPGFGPVCMLRAGLAVGWVHPAPVAGTLCLGWLYNGPLPCSEDGSTSVGSASCRRHRSVSGVGRWPSAPDRGACFVLQSGEGGHVRMATGYSNARTTRRP